MIGSTTTPKLSRWRTLAFAACLFAIVLGLKWATFDRFGSAMPDWDQWDAEGSELLVPWFEGDRFLAHLFHAHNEHRVVMTKLQNLALTLLNGQWDSRLEAVTNAVLHSTIVVAFWLVGVGWLGRNQTRRRGDTETRRGRDGGAAISPRLRVSASPRLASSAWFLLLIALFGLPIAWQNVLGGFHSQQYWLLGLSFAAIVALPFVRTWSAAWWAAAAAAGLALFTMGSGLLAPAIVFAVVAWRIFRRETTLRDTWPTLLWAGALVTIGLLTRVHFADHEPLKAKTVHDFVFSIVHSLQWPLRDRHWAGFVLWLPWLIITCRAVFRGTSVPPVDGAERSQNMGGTPMPPQAHGRDACATSRVDLTLAALGGWVLAQTVATAYARGVGADYPASRYMDTLAFGAAVNGLAVLWLIATAGPKDQRTNGPKDQRTNGPRDPGNSFKSPLVPWSFGPLVPARLGPLVLAVAWLVTFSFGLRAQLHTSIAWELPDAKKYYEQAERHVLGYLATSDPAHLAFKEIPYPSAESLIQRLVHPFLRDIMPAAVRPSLPVNAAEISVRLAFRENRAFAPQLENTPQSGLSPSTPPLHLRPTWGSFGAEGAKAVGRWTSAPLTAPLGGWLKFELAGARDPTDARSLQLLLADAQTGEPLASVVPDRWRADSWQPVYVRAPARPFVIRAIDDSAAGWFAFSAPVELGTLSYAAIGATRSGVWLAALGVLGALALVRSGTRERFAPERNAHALRDERSRAERAIILALAACLFLLIWGVKIFAVGRYGSDLAFWDQWAKEGEHLYIPWLERGEWLANLFVPHNEHRIAPTLAVDLGIVAAGGQWDSRVQCVVSAALHALIAAGLWLWAVRHLRRRWALAAGLLLAGVSASSLAFENVLTGFQSQFYFLIGFSLLAIGGLLSAPAFSMRWWGGFFAGLAALVSMGSGFLCAGPIIAVAFLRLWSREQRRDAAPTLIAALVLVALGAWLRTPTPWHDTLRAQNVTQFLGYAARCLAWPWPAQPWFAAVVWAPWLVLLAWRIRGWTATSHSSPFGLRRGNMREGAPKPLAMAAGRRFETDDKTNAPGGRVPPPDTAADFILAAGGWVLLQVAAVSYARGGGGDMPASRYGDVFSLGVIVGFFALALFAQQSSRRHRAPEVGVVDPSSRSGRQPVRRSLARRPDPCLPTATRPDRQAGTPAATLRLHMLHIIAGAAWLAAVSAAITVAAIPLWRQQFTGERAIRVLYENRVRDFLLTDDLATFEKETLPFPNADWLARILRHPEIRPILPVSVQPYRWTHAMSEPGEWRSAPLRPGRGWWKLETKGALGAHGTALELRAVSDGRMLGTIAPTKRAGEAWRAAYVAAPREPAILVARLDDAAHGFEFSEPVQMSALSYRVWRLARHGHWLALAGGLGGIALAMWFGRGTGLAPVDDAKRRQTMGGTPLPPKTTDETPVSP